MKVTVSSFKPTSNGTEIGYSQDGEWVTKTIPASHQPQPVLGQTFEIADEPVAPEAAVTAPPKETSEKEDPKAPPSFAGTKKTDEVIKK